MIFQSREKVNSQFFSLTKHTISLFFKRTDFESTYCLSPRQVEFEDKVEG